LLSLKRCRRTQNCEAAFCTGVLDKGIELFNKSALPENATMRESIPRTVNDFGQKRDQLRRFLLPFLAGNSNVLPLTAAQAEGARLYQECNDAIGKGKEGDACVRVRRCFNLDWLPY
jgi:hypothetical protein